VGETHPSRRHYTHTQAHRAYISEWASQNTHRHSMSLDISPITRIIPVPPEPPKPLDPPKPAEPSISLNLV